MMATIASLIFVVVLVVTIWKQRKAYEHAKQAAEEIDKIAAQAVPVMRTAYTKRYGRASTELDDAFPGQTNPPPNKEV